MSEKSQVAGTDWTVRRILEWTTAHLEKHGSETPRLDSEVLLAHARGCQRIQLYTRYDEALREDERSVMRDLVRRRAQSEPVAYLVGHREFFGLDFRVTPDVLIPRPDTETLVVELLELARPLASPRVLDIGTGTGCIAIAAAVNHPGGNFTAIDVSEPALAVARENAERHGVADRIRFLTGDLFAPLEAGERFEIIASNPPYIRDDEIETLQPDIRLHEPLSALVAGPDGLTTIRRLIAEAPRHLAPGGYLLMEIAPEQAAAVHNLLEGEAAYGEIRIIKDLPGKERVALARVLG